MSQKKLSQAKFAAPEAPALSVSGTASKPTTDAARATVDSFANFAAKVGIGTANLSSGNTYNFLPISRNRQLVEWMYRGSWICRNAVDAIADDMTREGITINAGLKPEGIEQLLGAISRRQIWQSMNAVSKWARLYGGCIGYIDIEGQDPSTKLRLESVGEGQFRGIIPMDRWMLNPDPVNAITTPGPDFGLPSRYQCVAASYSFPFPIGKWIHHTRVVRMEGVELPYWQKINENMWGISVMEPIYDRLTAFDSTTQGAAQLVYRAHLRSYQVEELRNIIAAGGDALIGLTKQIELMRLYQSNEGITLMDMKDKFETHSYNFGGLSDILDKMAEQISGATQIPIARLFGQSPGGMNSTGDHELRTYYDGVLRLQERWFRRPMDVILRCVAQSEGIEIGDDFSYEFKSLWQLTEVDMSSIDRNDTDSVLNARDAGLISDQMALKELRRRGRVSNRWQTITDEDVKAADDKVPDPAELMQAAGAGGAEGGSPGKGIAKTGETKPQKGTGDQARIIDVQGIPIHIETLKGELRKGVARDGTEWSVVMPAHYGFINGVPSAEGAFEELDCYIGDEEGAGQVFVIDQNDLETNDFDEHKCMIGFPDKAAALDAYIRGFSDGRGSDRILGITTQTVPQFKRWMMVGNFMKPLSKKAA